MPAGVATATGALEHVPMVRVVNLARLLGSSDRTPSKCCRQQASLLSALLPNKDAANEGSVSLSIIPRLAIVMGAEEVRGFYNHCQRRLTRSHCDHLVLIEIDSDVDSLNVSNAAAIALYVASGA